MVLLVQGQSLAVLYEQGELQLLATCWSYPRNFIFFLLAAHSVWKLLGVMFITVRSCLKNAILVAYRGLSKIADSVFLNTLPRVIG
jgi:hypothetical protein